MNNSACDDRQGSEEIVKFLLQKDKSLVWATTKLNRNVLHLASLQANFSMFKLLLHYLTHDENNNGNNNGSNNNKNNHNNERMMMMRDVVGGDVVSECVRSDCLPILQYALSMVLVCCVFVCFNVFVFFSFICDYIIDVGLFFNYLMLFFTTYYYLL